MPPSPDFRPSALSFDLESQLIGLRSLFLGLGEFFGVSVSGLLSIKSFDLESQLIGLRSLFLGLAIDGGSGACSEQLVRSRTGYASGTLVAPIDPFNDVGRVQVAVRGWSPSHF